MTRTLAVAADGRFSGYAALFGRVDQGGDVIQPGAFVRTLRKRDQSGVRMLFQHDPGQPVGVWEELREDTRGLFVKGRLLTGVVAVADLAQRINGGAVDGLSIGFRTSKARRVGGVRRLLDVDLWEVSIVTFPMMEGARIARAGLPPGADLSTTLSAMTALFSTPQKGNLSQ